MGKDDSSSLYLYSILEPRCQTVDKLARGGRVISFWEEGDSGHGINKTQNIVQKKTEGRITGLKSIIFNCVQSLLDLFSPLLKTCWQTYPNSIFVNIFIGTTAVDQRKKDEARWGWVRISSTGKKNRSMPRRLNEKKWFHGKRAITGHSLIWIWY